MGQRSFICDLSGGSMEIAGGSKKVRGAVSGLFPSAPSDPCTSGPTTPSGMFPRKFVSISAGFLLSFGGLRIICKGSASSASLVWELKPAQSNIVYSFVHLPSFLIEHHGWLQFTSLRACPRCRSLVCPRLHSEEVYPQQHGYEQRVWAISNHLFAY